MAGPHQDHRLYLIFTLQSSKSKGSEYCHLVQHGGLSKIAEAGGGSLGDLTERKVKATR